MTIELVAPKWVAGNEKRFAEYIGTVDNKSKVILLSHTDCDGLVSAKVVESVIPADSLELLGYSELNSSLVAKLKKQKATHVIITDLSITNREFLSGLEKLAKVLLIDHHLFEQDFNSERTVFMNAQGFSASYLVYYLFSSVQSLESLDWLVASSCLSDWCWKAPADWLARVFEKYGQKFRPEDNAVRTGAFWELATTIDKANAYYQEDRKKVYFSLGKEFGDLAELPKVAKLVQAEIDRYLTRFDKEKKEISEGYFWEVSPNYPIKEFLINDLSHRLVNHTLVVGCNSSDNQRYLLSARRQDGKVDVSMFMKKAVEGLEGASAGGHRAAAGGHVLLKDKQRVLERLGVKA